ncbi:MAG: transporter substrate-binding domain-containing protein [Burkholderiaceae bacterium]
MATDPLKVGVLFSQTGSTAFVERTQCNATLLAIEAVNERGGVGGRPVLPVVRDAKSSVPEFVALASRLLEEDRVPLIFGCYMTNTRQALVPLVERRNAVLAYPAPYEGFEYSRNVFYGGAVPNQHIVPLARHLMASAGKRFYLVGTRYTFPVESNRVMMTLVSEGKGEIVAERYVPLDVTRHELAALARHIRSKRPDVVFCTIVGEAAARFHAACREEGIAPSDTTIAGLTITEAEVQLMGADLACGHLTAATYFESIDSPANRRFLDRYRSAYGPCAHANAMAETAWSLTSMVLAAADRCGSVDADALRDDMAGHSFEAPQGVIRLDPQNNHFYLWPRVARVRPDGGFEIIETARSAVKPDPYLINHGIIGSDPGGQD